MASFDILVGPNNGKIVDTIAGELRIISGLNRYIDLGRDLSKGVRMIDGANGLIAEFVSGGTHLGTNTVLAWGRNSGPEFAFPSKHRFQVSAGLEGAFGRALWLNRDGGNVVVGKGDGTLNDSAGFNVSLGKLGVATSLLVGTGFGGAITATTGASHAVGIGKSSSSLALDKAGVYALDASGASVPVYAKNTPAAWGRLVYTSTGSSGSLVLSNYFNVSAAVVTTPGYTVGSLSSPVRAIRVTTVPSVVSPTVTVSPRGIVDTTSNEFRSMTVQVIDNLSKTVASGGISLYYSSGGPNAKVFYFSVFETSGTQLNRTPAVSGVAFTNLGFNTGSASSWAFDFEVRGDVA